MGKNLGKIIVWLAIHIGFFLVACWFFLGMSPFETYRKTVSQLSGYVREVKYGFHNFFDASTRLAGKANKYGLQEAKDVMAGKDYYEGYDVKLDNQLREEIRK